METLSTTPPPHDLECNEYDGQTQNPVCGVHEPRRQARIVDQQDCEQKKRRTDSRQCHNHQCHLSHRACSGATLNDFAAKIDNTEAFVRKIVENVEPRPWSEMYRRLSHAFLQLKIEGGIR